MHILWIFSRTRFKIIIPKVNQIQKNSKSRYFTIIFSKKSILTAVFFPQKFAKMVLKNKNLFPHFKVDILQYQVYCE